MDDAGEGGDGVFDFGGDVEVSFKRRFGAAIEPADARAFSGRLDDSVRGTGGVSAGMASFGRDQGGAGCDDPAIVAGVVFAGVFVEFMAGNVGRCTGRSGCLRASGVEVGERGVRLASNVGLAGGGEGGWEAGFR